MVQRVFAINSTVRLFARYLLQGHVMTANSWACGLIQGNTFRLPGGSNMLSVAQGCISSNGVLCVYVCAYTCVLVCGLEKWSYLFEFFFFQILTLSPDQICSPRRQQILVEVWFSGHSAYNLRTWLGGIMLKTWDVIEQWPFGLIKNAEAEGLSEQFCCWWCCWQKEAEIEN